MRRTIQTVLAVSFVLAGCAVRADEPKPGERPVMTGKGMKTKLGVLYLSGNPESRGLLDLIEQGRMSIIKVPLNDITRAEDTQRARSRGKNVGSDIGNFQSRALILKKRNPKAIVITGMSCNAKIMAPRSDPVEAAEKRFKAMEGQLKKLEPHKDKVDFLELFPCMWEPDSPEMGRWYSRFTEVLARKVGEAGYRPIVLTSGVGGLPIKPELLDAMAPGLRAAKKYGGAWACHGYTLEYTRDAQKESHYSLRYRRAYDYLRKAHPDIADLPIIMVEGGVDYRGDPDKDGWQARGSQKKFEDWLAWYDGELLKDPQVLGVTLFKAGSMSTWKSFDLEPVCGWLTEYLDHHGR